MAETLLIRNPIAGRGAGERLWPRIAAELADLSLDFEMETTEGPGHAACLAAEAAAQGIHTVVAVGGDGTVNEVLNGLMKAGDGANQVALGILPIGTGNDLAFGAGLPLDLEAACRVLAGGEGRDVDVGCVRADNERPLYFGNGVGLGFDAMVNIESRKLRRLRGFLVYLVAVFRTMAFYYHAPQTRISIDGLETTQASLMISVMNGSRVGGGFHVTPGSQMDDGHFDLCIAGALSRPEMLAFVPRFMRGSHTTDRRITMAQGRTVSVSCESPWAGHVDGEIYGLGGQHFEIELLPQRLHLLC
jgi:diacylglycerol kinase (ATP)